MALVKGGWIMGNMEERKLRGECTIINISQFMRDSKWLCGNYGNMVCMCGVSF